MSANSKTHSDHGSVGAVIVAAGESRRMGDIDKIFHPLGGKPLIWYSLSVMNSHPRVSQIALVVSERSVKRAEELVEASAFSNVTHICAGGNCRQDSVSIGINALPESDLIIVHDGARPFLNASLLDSGIDEAVQNGSACAAVPVKDTIKSADDSNFVTQTLQRNRLWSVQTPQVFRRKLLAEAHRKVRTDVTDDASMVEAMGYAVRLFMGSYYNIKITTPEDLILAQAILSTGTPENCGQKP